MNNVKVLYEVQGEAKQEEFPVNPWFDTHGYEYQDLNRAYDNAAAYAEELKRSGKVKAVRVEWRP